VRVRERAHQLEPQRSIELEVPDTLLVAADETLLSRALDNLVDNARKYDPQGRPIRLQGQRDGASVVLAVQDAGPGIPDEDLASIFEPFFRGQSARSKAGGFGLGLALARRVAEAHGGTIGASNVAGGGTRIELRIPDSA
jgi:two-component system OmpR family sensor kinase